jgi:serralysin
MADGDVFVAIERIYGSNHQDSLIGSDENNFLAGYGGNDLLTGLSGNDLLRGGAGADLLRGGAGADLLDGGEGIDTADYRDSDAGVSVNLATGLASGGMADGDVFVAIERIYGSSHRDSLIGSDENNFLAGYDEDDLLAGGLGNDTLMGGQGRDIFLFNASLNKTGNKDILRDFQSNQDLIHLDKDIFAALTDEGTLHSDLFCANTTGTALDDNDSILYNTSSGALLYDADGSGEGVSVQFATLTNKPEISANDFLFIA